MIATIGWDRTFIDFKVVGSARMRHYAHVVCLLLSSYGCKDGTAPATPTDDTNEPLALATLGIGRVSDYTTGELAIHPSGIAYTTTVVLRGDVVHIWDIQPAVPVLRSTIKIPNVSQLGDVQISEDNNLLLVAAEFGRAGLYIYDIRDPNQPTLLRYIDPATIALPALIPSNVHTAKWAVINGKRYIFAALPQSFPTGVLAIIDVTTIANPVIVKIIQSASYVHDVFVRDGVLIAAEWDAGITMWDVGNGRLAGSPANPKLILRSPVIGGSAHNVWWYHNTQNSNRYLIVGAELPGIIPSRTSGDIHVIDISSAENPKQVAFYRADRRTTWNGETAGAHNFWMDEEAGLLYAAFYNGGVRVLDLRGDLSGCSSTQKAADGRCDLALMGREVAKALTNDGPVGIWGVRLWNKRLYASDMLNGLWTVDAAALNPSR